MAFYKLAVIKESVVPTESSGDDGSKKFFALLAEGFIASWYNFTGDKLTQLEHLGYLCVVGSRNCLDAHVDKVVATTTLLVGVLRGVFIPAAFALLFVIVVCYFALKFFVFFGLCRSRHVHSYMTSCSFIPTPT